MSPLVDAGAVLDDDSDLPRTVSWLELHDPRLADDPAAVIERWQESRSILTGPAAPAAGPRRAPAPCAPSSARRPASRTRSTCACTARTRCSAAPPAPGKSELLQTWILAMAAAHSPQRVTFLLVDYKGGSAFRDCVNLPHTVGLVTDLSPHLVTRALASLRAELTYREHLFSQKKVKDLLELEQTGDPDTPPSLVIVVDEFAALVQEVPDFVDGVVNVAQRGRSLGLHLVLATQRPTGVIKDNLRANTNLRLALRMADEARQHRRARLAGGGAHRPGAAGPRGLQDRAGPAGAVPGRLRRRLDDLRSPRPGRTIEELVDRRRAAAGAPPSRPPRRRTPTPGRPTAPGSPRPSAAPAPRPSCRRRAGRGWTSWRPPTT